MEHVQNATLAGGVAMGTAANMSVEPYGALINGFVAGALSTVGYAYIKVQLFCLKIVQGLNLKFFSPSLPRRFLCTIHVVLIICTECPPFRPLLFLLLPARSMLIRLTSKMPIFMVNYKIIIILK